MKKGLQIPQFFQQLFRWSLISLPFSYYISALGMAGIFSNMVYVLSHIRKTTVDLPVRNGLLLISGLMVISSCLAENQGEAFLQMTHFLPYFVLFLVLPYLLRGTERLEQVATDLVITSIPINVIALIQYILRSPYIPRPMRRIPIVHWVRQAPHRGRAMAMFDHPNVLASYLVVVFGLGLGLILARTLHARMANLSSASSSATDLKPRKRVTLPTWLLIFATYFNLVGIFSAGSRNGLVIAVSQLIIFSLFISFFTRVSRAIGLTGLVSLLAIVLGTAFLGIGGRALSIVDWANDPRLGVWQIAIDLIQERPWLGWGLGNYKFLYPARLINPNYPNIFHPHNFWLLLASEAGLLVMLGLTLLVGYICYRAALLLVKQQVDLAEGGILMSYFLGFWGIFVFGLFDVTFYDARINVLNWLVLAGIYSFERWHKMAGVKRG